MRHIKRARKDRASFHDEARTLEGAALGGAAAGALLGAVAGPPGMVAGAMVGTAMGVIAGIGLDDADLQRSAHDRELDDEIGVTKGDLGAAPANAPPPRFGAYSAASGGMTNRSVTPCEGPMQDIDES